MGLCPQALAHIIKSGSNSRGRNTAESESFACDATLFSFSFFELSFDIKKLKLNDFQMKHTLMDAPMCHVQLIIIWGVPTQFISNTFPATFKLHTICFPAISLRMPTMSDWFRPSTITRCDSHQTKGPIRISLRQVLDGCAVANQVSRLCPYLVARMNNSTTRTVIR